MNVNRTPLVLAFALLAGLFVFGCTQSASAPSATPASQGAFSPTPMGGLVSNPQARVYSLADVAAHDQLSDCWVVLRGNVYDVTPLVQNPAPSAPPGSPEGGFRLNFASSCGQVVNMTNGGFRNGTNFTGGVATRTYNNTNGTGGIGNRSLNGTRNRTGGFGGGPNGGAGNPLANLQVGVLEGYVTPSSPAR